MTGEAASAENFEPEDGNEELWRQIFVEGHPLLVKKHSRYKILPSDPRCKLCFAPFKGIGGWMMRRIGLTPSVRNPRFCSACDPFLKAYPGGAEVPLSLLFADIRNSVALSGSMPPKEFSKLVQSVREAVVSTLTRTDGFVLEFQGDSIIGVWPPGFSGPDHASKAVRAADELIKSAPIATVRGIEVPIGIGVHTGKAYLCTVSAANGRLQEVGAFGLDVNIAARLSASAKPGKAFVSVAAYEAARLPYDTGATQRLELKGVETPLQAVLLG